MSQAFVKEPEQQWLHEIDPTIAALTAYLSRENNGVRVYEQSTSSHKKTNKPVYYMSNGLGYSLDDDSRWYVV